MVRVLASVLVILSITGSAASAVCAGWETSAADRMECCRRAGHVTCVEQGLSDNCCAGGEETRQIAAPGTIAKLLSPFAGASPALLPFRQVFAFGARTAATRDVDVRLHAPPHPLITPLRI